jgi:SAM-dependent methyltransferase
MTTKQVDPIPVRLDGCEDYSIWISCWQCGTSLEIASLSETQFAAHLCRNCNATTECRNGIWHSISPQRSNYFSCFISNYEIIRAAEGRGSSDADYYLGLPYKDLSEKNSGQWAIRATTYRHIERKILPSLSKLQDRPLRILDLGAGNGWMSYRLTLLGHSPIAVDLLTNDQDGLGAATHFSTHIQPLFPRIRAELDNLPFASFAFDLVIFNASFHYSENFERSMAEAFRCTRIGGSVLIADSPWYANEGSGRSMVQEKHRHFSEKYGFPSNSIDSLEYLSPDRLAQLQNRFDAEWNTFTPFYGISWSLRPLRAKLFNRRSPSQFRIYTARLNA